MDVDAEYICGDINKESIKDVWSRRNERMVRYHLSHEWDKLPAICRSCNDWSIIGEERFDADGNPVAKNYESREAML